VKIAVVVPSIRLLFNLQDYMWNFREHDYEPDLIVIDEEHGVIRERNREMFPKAEFYGAKERTEWFTKRGLDKYADVIPEKTHAETSFGLLVAYERKSDVILFLDDDTKPLPEVDFLSAHLKNLNDPPCTVQTRGTWVNVLGESTHIFPRGFPYGERQFATQETGTKPSCEVVLNQGLWNGVLDHNAVDILVYGGLQGLDGILRSSMGTAKSHTVPIGKYATTCSMNLCFKREIVPAFYQLPMNSYGIDRFDDVWSGIFLKKVLNRIGKAMSYGQPLCVHEKVPRDVFRDIRAELEGLVINERLWRVVDDIELYDRDYLLCYRGIASELYKRANEFHMPKYVRFLGEKMTQWTNLMDKL